LDLFYEMSQINAIVNEFGGALPAIYQTRPDLENTGKEWNKLGKVKRRLPSGLTWDKPVWWFSETCLSVLDYVYKIFVSNGLYIVKNSLPKNNVIRRVNVHLKVANGNCPTIWRNVWMDYKQVTIWKLRNDYERASHTSTAVLLIHRPKKMLNPSFFHFLNAFLRPHHAVLSGASYTSRQPPSSFVNVRLKAIPICAHFFASRLPSAQYTLHSDCTTTGHTPLIRHCSDSINSHTSSNKRMNSTSERSGSFSHFFNLSSLSSRRLMRYSI
jgi:hypothetical protein